MKTTPKLITDDYQPSQDLYKWCDQVGLDLGKVHTEMYSFIHWHKEKGIRRANFNLAFRNWLKRTLPVLEKQKQEIKKGSQSFKDYKPANLVTCNKSAGREALKQLRGMI